MGKTPVKTAGGVATPAPKPSTGRTPGKVATATKSAVSSTPRAQPTPRAVTSSGYGRTPVRAPGAGAGATDLGVVDRVLGSARKRTTATSTSTTGRTPFNNLTRKVDTALKNLKGASSSGVNDIVPAAVTVAADGDGDARAVSLASVDRLLEEWSLAGGDIEDSTPTESPAPTATVAPRDQTPDAVLLSSCSDLLDQINGLVTENEENISRNDSYINILAQKAASRRASRGSARTSLGRSSFGGVVKPAGNSQLSSPVTAPAAVVENVVYSEQMLDPWDQL